MVVGLLTWSIGCAVAAAQPSPPSPARAPAPSVRAPTAAAPAPAGESAPASADGAPLPTDVVLLVSRLDDNLELAHDDLAFTFLQLPLNHAGLRLRERALTDGEPADLDPTTVRAVGTWLAPDDALPDWVWPWLERQPRALKVLHLGSLAPLSRGDDGVRLRRHLQRFGLGYDAQVVSDPSRIRVTMPRPDLYPFESRPVYERLHLGPWNLDERNTVWVATQDARNPRLSRAPVITGAWGGIALQPWFLRPGGVDLDRRWYADPFAFCREALGLHGVPAPDPCVLTGRRMFVLHVDGDGFESRSTVVAGRNCGEVFRDHIVDAWPMPMTISFVVASLTDDMHPAEPTAGMRIAREIAARPWVELASHSVLHPLDWRRRLDPRSLPRTVVWYRELAGYEHSMVAEVRDSIAFADRWLARPGERCRVMLWSGAANPPAAAIRAATEAGCTNLNGGLFRCDALHDSIGFVSPWGRAIGDQWQVFAGAANENEFPGFYTTMPGAFAHVATTIERTGGNRILKPANVYCHFYSAEHPARLAALESLLRRFVREAETVPVFASRYAAAVHDAQHSCAITPTTRGFRFTGFGYCRTVRIDGPTQALDWPNCRGLVGARRLGDRLFLHLGQPEGEVAFAAGAAPWLHVEQADCELGDVVPGPRELRLSATSFAARRVVVAGAAPGTVLRVAVDGQEHAATADAAGRCDVVMRDAGTSEVRVWRP